MIKKISTVLMLAVFTCCITVAASTDKKEVKVTKKITAKQAKKALKKGANKVMTFEAIKRNK